jgi:hypothetical protein
MLCARVWWHTKTYIGGTDDRAIPPKLQRYMSDALGADFLPIVTDHSPFYSAPEALVAALLDADRRHR